MVTLLLPWAACATPTYPSVKNLFLTPNLNLPGATWCYTLMSCHLSPEKKRKKNNFTTAFFQIVAEINKFVVILLSLGSVLYIVSMSAFQTSLKTNWVTCSNPKVLIEGSGSPSPFLPTWLHIASASHGLAVVDQDRGSLFFPLQGLDFPWWL